MLSIGPLGNAQSHRKAVPFVLIICLIEFNSFRLKNRTKRNAITACTHAQVLISHSRSDNAWDSCKPLAVVALYLLVLSLPHFAIHALLYDGAHVSFLKSITSEKFLEIVLKSFFLLKHFWFVQQFDINVSCSVIVFHAAQDKFTGLRALVNTASPVIFSSKSSRLPGDYTWLRLFSFMLIRWYLWWVPVQINGLTFWK